MHDVRPLRRPLTPARPQSPASGAQADLFGQAQAAPPVAQPRPQPSAAPAAPRPLGRPSVGVGLRSLASQTASDEPMPPEAPTPGATGAARSSNSPLRPGSPSPDANDNPKVELVGRIQKKIFGSDDGFRVYLIQVKKETFSLATNSPTTINDGDKVIATGEWNTYKGKKSFKATLVVHDLPKNGKGFLAWIKTGAVPGVGAKKGDRVARHFGDDVVDVAGDAERLLEAGIDRKSAEAIAEAWLTNAMAPELVAFLGGLGLGEITITKIMRRYGMTTKQVIAEKPWQLADTIEGIGFVTADDIARRYGHDRASPDRIQAGLRYALREAVAKDGHCGLPIDVLVDRTQKLLALDRSLVSVQVQAALDSEGVVYDETTGLASPRAVYRAEVEVAQHLMKLLDYPAIDLARAEQIIDQAQNELGIKLDASQRDAAILALTNSVCIITGGPGTGKSTTQKVIVAALRHLGRDVVLAAPTGRAAKRLAEVSGLPASTCHRLLQYQDGEFAFNAGNPFTENWFIVDEFSMVDIRLAWSFIQAIKEEACLTIVGDVDQLPSVGAGQVLRDLITSGSIPTARLTTVHRQGNDSGIVTAAHRINSGHHPQEDPSERLKGFAIKSASDSSSLVSRVVQLVASTLPSKGYDPLKDIQVLAAQRKGDVGVERLNEALKAALNPADPTDGRSVEIRGRTFTVGDRVMQNRNDYVKSVYNGEVGVVTKVGQRQPKEDGGKPEAYFAVDYSGYEVSYTAKDLDDIEPCWAATVHKSQGCEFPVVVFVCPAAHARMLTRNLLYTGVTRAKTLCILAGDEGTIERAPQTVDTMRRYTGLAKRLTGPALEDQSSPNSAGLGFLQIEE